MEERENLTVDGIVCVDENERCNVGLQSETPKFFQVKHSFGIITYHRIKNDKTTKLLKLSHEMTFDFRDRSQFCSIGHLVV